MSIFSNSLATWIQNFSVNSAIMMVMMIFMIVGAIDRMLGNKFGYGEEFEKGFSAMGPLALAMAGVIAAAPLLAQMLGPIISPIYAFMGADPAMFATTIIGTDVGGYALAMELAANPAIGNFAGLILGTMMGITIVFTIPVALAIIKEEDRPYLAAGLLAGMVTIPLGCIAGGLAMNLTEFKLDIMTILTNLVPVIIIASLIILGLWFFPVKMIHGFNYFGNFVTIMITFFTAVAVFQQITGIMFPYLYVMSVKDDVTGLSSLDSGLLICGQIGIVLIGAFPMVKWITRTFGSLLHKFGAALKINDVAASGLIANLANNIAMFNLMGQMNPKGKLINVAFAVSAAFTFGDHLGFTAGVESQMIFPVVVGKLTAGITAIIVANLLAPKLLNKINNVL